MPGSSQRLEQELAGHYVIERELARGGMAVVYVALDVRHRRRVAIKVLHPDLAVGIAAERFAAEIEIAASLTHPNILPVFDSGGSGDCLYYVMPLVEGESLRARLDREKRLPLDEAVRITRQIADALEYAHGRNIIHRDIKPENVLFVGGHAVLADFGIARAVQQSETRRLTFTGIAIGTPLYMSPEQASGDPNIDQRSDIYSLACVLYEMLGGRPPHPGDTPQEVLAAKLVEEPAPLQSTGADVPRIINDVVRKALSAETGERYAHMREFSDALAAATDFRTAIPWRRGQRSAPLRVKRGAVALFGSIALIGAAGVFAAWRRASLSPVSDDGRTTIAVLPFRPTSASAERWGEAIPDLLATTLDGTPGLRVVDPWSLWRPLRPTPNAAARSPDPREADAIAANAHACCFLLGSVSELPGQTPQVELSIRVYRRGAQDAIQTFGMTAPVDSLASLVRRVAIELIQRLSSTNDALALGSTGRGLTRSPEALKSWLVAREGERRGQLDSADAAIMRAMAADSNFVLALNDAATIKTWLQFARGERYAGLRAIARRAVQLSDSVGERPRLRAQATLASIETQGSVAANALQRIVTLDSLDQDAWSMLAYVHMSYGWQYGASERDMIAAADRAVRLDSTNAMALFRRLYLAIATNDAEDMQVQLRRVQRADTTLPIIRGLVVAARALQASDAAFPALADTIAHSPLPAWISAVRVLRMFRPDRTELLLSRTRAATGAPAANLTTVASVQLAAAEGRWGSIDSMRQAGTFRGIPGVDRAIDRELVAGEVAGAGDDALARRAAASLGIDFPPDSALAFFNRKPMVWLDGWLLGAYHAMYGDTSLARRWSGALGRLPKGGSPADYGEALAADIDSRLAARQGDRVASVAKARRALELWSIHTDNQEEFQPEPAMRFHLASLLRAANQPDSAADLYRSLVPPTTWMGYYTTRSALELSEIEIERGRRAEAQRHLLTALRAWERGDSSVARLLDRARRAASRVGEERAAAF